MISKSECQANCSPGRTNGGDFYHGCRKQCDHESSRPQSYEEYICKYYGAQEYFNKFGVSRCGHTIYDTADMQSFLAQQNAKQGENKMLLYVGMGLLALIGIFAYKFLFSSGK